MAMLWKDVYGHTLLQDTRVVKRWMSVEDKPPSKENNSAITSQRRNSKVETIYKILETVLVSEIVLFLFGGFFVTNMDSISLRILYWIVIPWSTLITGILFLIVRYMKRNYLREEVPS